MGAGLLFSGPKMSSNVHNSTVAAVSGAVLFSLSLFAASASAQSYVVGNLSQDAFDEFANASSTTVLANFPSVASATVNGGVFQSSSLVSSSGSGTFTSIYRVDNNNTTVHGFNFNNVGFTGQAAKLPFDQKSGVGTLYARLSDLPYTSIGGTLYREFLLDANESNSTPTRYISLDQVVVFTSPNSRTASVGGVPTTMADSPTISSVDANLQPTISGIGSGTIVQYSLRTASVIGSIIVDSYSNFSAGSGNADLAFYVPDSAFDSARAGGNDPWVHLYSSFGGLTGTGGRTTSVFKTTATNTGPTGVSVTTAFRNESGFEEWAYLGGTTFVPEPSTYALGLGGLALVGAAIVRRRKAA